MKKGFILFSTSILVFILLGISQLQAQNITIDPGTQYGSSTPTAGYGVCPCDTLGVTAKPSNPFSPLPKLVYSIGPLGVNPNTNAFYYVLSYDGLTRKDTLILIPPLEDNLGSPTSAFTSGVKRAQLAVPCSAPSTANAKAYLLIYNRDTVAGVNESVSDSVYLTMGRLPDEPVIDSIAGGFVYPYDNLGDKWAFCQGDTITLYTTPQPGVNIQWFKEGGMADTPWPQNNPSTVDSVKIWEPGTYFVRMSTGFCEKDSKDTVINIVVVPTDIIVDATSPAFQIDNAFPDDSISFCGDGFANLIGPDSSDNFGVAFTYQWLTDTTASGPVQYLLADSVSPGNPRKDTSQVFVVDSTLFSLKNGAARLYLEVTDSNGCRDTSDAYYIYMDSIPETDISHRIYTNGALGGVLMSPTVCFKDSVQLRATYGASNLSYQWESATDSSSVWTSMVNDTLRTLVLDSTSTLLRYYRVRTTTKAPVTGVPVCEAVSDVITIRWWERDSITYQPQPWIHDVGLDSISLCATDSAVLVAPQTPNRLINNSLFYSYQWLRDSAGIQVPITAATQRTFTTNQSGTYYVEINDGICTEIIRDFKVFVDSVPSTSIVTTPFPNGATSDLNLCLTDSTLLTAVDTILPGWNYQWEYLADTAIGWETMTADTMPWITVDTAYNTGNDTVLFRLSLNYENDFGLTICDGYSDTLQVVFYNPPIVNVFPGDSIGVCAGDSVLVIAQGNSLSHLWTPTGEVTSSIWISTPGVYTVRGTGINGCRTTARVVVYPITTTANAGPDVTTTSGTDVFLSGSGGTGYRWYASKPIAWSDNSSPNIQVSYTLPDGVKSDTITIYLEATNTAGCLDTDSLLLIVNADEDPGISLVDQAWNVFTPGDGNDKNNTWDIRAITNQYSACRIDIMNRWGSIIFNQEDFNGIWDGRDNGGQDAPEGTYYYLLSCDGEVILKNAVTIIRNQ